jgi:hypothetical protein
MTDDRADLHAATGRIFLTAIHIGQKRQGLAAVTALRWQDETGRLGQSSHARLAQYIDAGGKVCVQHEGEVFKVAVEPKNRFLYTANVDRAEDPILNLQHFVGHK